MKAPSDGLLQFSVVFFPFQRRPDRLLYVPPHARGKQCKLNKVSACVLFQDEIEKEKNHIVYTKLMKYCDVAFLQNVIRIRISFFFLERVYLDEIWSSARVFFEL